MDNSHISKRITDSAPLKEKPLESWGEIASYVRRDIRTVQRWEKDHGLPIRRLLLGKQGQVFALPSELDKWLLERQPKPHTPKGDTQPYSRRRIKLIEFLGILVTGLAILVAIVSFATKRYFASSPEKTLMFVRPFANYGGDPRDDAFVAGLTDEIITQMGKLDPITLGVFAPTTSKELSTKSIQELKKELNANYILEGSVRRANGQLRIDVLLVMSRDQTPIWTKSYTGDAKDVLLLQDEVATGAARAARVTIPNSSDNVRAAGLQAVDPSAYDAYLAGRLYWWLDRDVTKSLAKYKEALEIDPNYAPARAGLAMSYLLMQSAPIDELQPNQAIPLAREAAQRALQLDPKLAEPYCELANIAMYYDHDPSEAERLFKRAIEVDGGNETAHRWYGLYLMVTNQMDAAEKEMNRAQQIDPASPIISSHSAELKYYQRDYDEAIKRATQILEKHPGYIYAELWLASAYREKKLYPEAISILDRLRKQSNNNPCLLSIYGHALGISGDKDGALKVLAQLQQIAQDRYVPSIYMATVYIGLGDSDHAFEWLERSYSERHDRFYWIGIEPLANPLRSDPRFKELLKRVGLEYLQAQPSLNPAKT